MLFTEFRDLSEVRKGLRTHLLAAKYCNHFGLLVICGVQHGSLD